MKAAALLTIMSVIFCSSAFAQGQTYQQGYTRKDGTYVQPHYKTTPDNNIYNNWSTKGNTNPYTQQNGTVDPYRQPNYNSFGTNSNSTKSRCAYGTSIC